MAFYFSTFVPLKKVQIIQILLLDTNIERCLNLNITWIWVLFCSLIYAKKNSNGIKNHLPKILIDIFRDEDGDLITLRNSLDLEVALSYSRVLKLTLFIHGKISAEDKSTKNIFSKNLVKELKSIRNRITEILDSILDEVNETNSDEDIVKDIG